MGSQSQSLPAWETTFLSLAGDGPEGPFKDMVVKTPIVTASHCCGSSMHSLSNLIKKYLESRSTKIIPVLNRLNAISFGKDEMAFDRRAAVLKECFRLLQHATQPPSSDLRVYPEVVAFIEKELDQCPGDLLASTVEHIEKRIEMNTAIGATVATMSSTRPTSPYVYAGLISLLPKMLQLLGRFVTVIDSKKKDYPGLVYKETTINRMLAPSWNAAIAVPLCHAFVDVEGLTEPQIARVVVQMSKTLNVAPAEQLPEVVRLMLQFAKKGQRQEVAYAIAAFFTNCGNEIRENAQGHLLIPTEKLPEYSKVVGLVLKQLNFSLRQDQQMATTFYNMMSKAKANTVLSYFNIALLLTVSPIYRIEEQVCDMLKGKVMTILRDEMRVESSPWRVNATNSHRSLRLQDYVNYTSIDIQGAMLALSREYQQGWQAVTKGLIQLALAFVDSSGIVVGRQIVDSSTSKKWKGEEELTVTERAAEQGCQILLEIYKNHTDFRSMIMENLETRIITSGATTRIGLALLEKIVKFVETSQPTTVGRIPRIREIADCFQVMSAAFASQAFYAYRPLVENDGPFQQQMMLLLRKGMFSVEMNQRKFALRGLVFLLEVCLSRSGEADWDTGSSSGKPGRALMLEITLMIRRYLIYPIELKRELFSRLSSLLVKYKNQEFAAAVYVHIHPQLKSLQAEDATHRVPIIIQKCLDASDEDCFIKEPLPQLASCLCNAAIVADLQTQGRAGVASAAAIPGRGRTEMKVILNRLTELDAFDFGLDKEASFDQEVQEGQKNLQLGELLLGLYEAFMEYCYRSGRVDDNIHKLQTRYVEMWKFLKENLAKKDTKLRACLDTSLSFDTIVYMIVRLYNNNEAGGVGGPNDAQKNLRGRKDYLRYLFSSALYHLHQLTDRGIQPRYREDTFIVLKDLGKTLFKICSQDELNNVEDAKKKAKTVAAYGMDVLKALVFVVRDQYKSRFNEFGEYALRYRSRNGNADASQTSDQALQKLVESFIQKSEYREATSALVVLEEVPDLKVDEAWLERLAQSGEVTDALYVKAIMQMVLRNVASGDESLLGKLYFDIALAADPLGEEEELDVDNQFALFARHKSTTSASLVISAISGWLEDAMWCIRQLQAFSADGDLQPTQTRNEEQDPICKLLSLWSKIIFVFNNRIWPELVVDSLTRCVTKLFKAAYYLTNWKLKHHTEVNDAYLDVVKAMANLSKSIAENALLRETAEREKQADGDHGAKKGKNKRPASAKAPKNIIPLLVEMEERYNIALINLGKKDPKVQQYVKRSTARDFKIDNALLNMDSEEGEGEEEDQQPNKKRRTALRDPGEDDE
ncbi:hypothetical protein SmJEL517_g00791 [Synchytrium microbalum]|uniref:Uncharacterized protein n=1 Tax=Synchytrium microbalum TaxID=1806994 RepID=A0A507CGR7_9FUNG|nr:uncharacterized protein SmJEL517_g00791 [Synchytrium microbalum]TPX37174.1 hypothetical protein SmJEL517_g00791 [Synchytrium microbalum]